MRCPDRLVAVSPASGPPSPLLGAFAALVCLALTLQSLAGCTRHRLAQRDPGQRFERRQDVTFDELLQKPAAYQGRPIRTTAPVQRVFTDKLLFVGPSENRRMLTGFAVRARPPSRLEEGHRLRLEARVLGPREAERLMGPNIDARARLILRAQSRVLVVPRGAHATVVDPPATGLAGP